MYVPSTACRPWAPLAGYVCINQLTIRHVFALQKALSSQQDGSQAGVSPVLPAAVTEPEAAAEQPPRPLRRRAPQRTRGISAHGQPGEEDERIARTEQRLGELRVLQNVGAKLVTA